MSARIEKINERKASLIVERHGKERAYLLDGINALRASSDDRWALVTRLIDIEEGLNAGRRVSVDAQPTSALSGKVFRARIRGGAGRSYVLYANFNGYRVFGGVHRIEDDFKKVDDAAEAFAKRLAVLGDDSPLGSSHFVPIELEAYLLNGRRISGYTTKESWIGYERVPDSSKEDEPTEAESKPPKVKGKHARRGRFHAPPAAPKSSSTGSVGSGIEPPKDPPKDEEPKYEIPDEADHISRVMISLLIRKVKEALSGRSQAENAVQEMAKRVCGFLSKDVVFAERAQTFSDVAKTEELIVGYETHEEAIKTANAMVVETALAILDEFPVFTSVTNRHLLNENEPGNKAPVFVALATIELFRRYLREQRDLSNLPTKDLLVGLTKSLTMGTIPEIEELSEGLASASLLFQSEWDIAQDHQILQDAASTLTDVELVKLVVEQTSIATGSNRVANESHAVAVSYSDFRSGRAGGLVQAIRKSQESRSASISASAILRDTEVTVGSRYKNDDWYEISDEPDWLRDDFPTTPAQMFFDPNNDHPVFCLGDFEISNQPVRLYVIETVYEVSLFSRQKQAQTTRGFSFVAVEPESGRPLFILAEDVDRYHTRRAADIRTTKFTYDTDVSLPPSAKPGIFPAITMDELTAVSYARTSTNSMHPRLLALACEQDAPTIFLSLIAAAATEETFAPKGDS